MSTILDELTNNLMFTSFRMFYMESVSFGSWLNAEIEGRNWSIRETARQAGISPTLITNIINLGERPSYDTCVALARALEKPIQGVLVRGFTLPIHS